MKTRSRRKTREELLGDALPQLEQFIGSREAYIRALETTIEALKRENQRYNQNNLAIRNSIDEMVALQQLSNVISTAVEPEQILSTLIELTQDIIPVIECNIFLLDVATNKLQPFGGQSSQRLNEEAQQQLEAGILDWVFSEKRTVTIPDLQSLGAEGEPRNFVIVPLMLRNNPVGVYIIHTSKPQQEFSNRDVQLLTVLANQAAAGVENCKTHRELLQANEQLKISKAQMVQAAKLAAVGELAAGILHEIKNPVQILMMNLGLMKSGRTIPNWESLLEKQVQRLADMTRRLTKFSRAAEEEPRMDPVDVNAALQEIVEMVQHQWRTEKITIDLKLAPALPKIMGNANVLQQLFLNMLINARDAMPRGGQCTITTGVKDLSVRITIADTGVGIRPEYRSRIFEPFFTTKEEGKGTGLGLSICKTIVAQHRGTIDVESEPDRGTTFTITLPLRGGLTT